MNEEYQIPSTPEVIVSQRETHVELMVRVTGGALPDEAAVVFKIPTVVLTSPGQMLLDFHEDDVSNIDYSADSLPPTPNTRLTLHIENALLRPEHGESLYSFEVEREES